MVVRGRVQGGFFRDTCRCEAERLGVTSYVRNERDGTVSAEFEGAPAAVDAMVEWVRQGPQHTRVESVDVESVAPQGTSAFRIA